MHLRKEEQGGEGVPLLVCVSPGDAASEGATGLEHRGCQSPGVQCSQAEGQRTPFHQGGCHGQVLLLRGGCNILADDMTACTDKNSPGSYLVMLSHSQTCYT